MCDQVLARQLGRGMSAPIRAGDSSRKHPTETRARTSKSPPQPITQRATAILQAARQLLLELLLGPRANFGRCAYLAPCRAITRRVERQLAELGFDIRDREPRRVR